MAEAIKLDDVQVGDRVLHVTDIDGCTITTTGLVSELAEDVDFWDFVLNDAHECYVDDTDVLVLLEATGSGTVGAEPTPALFKASTLVLAQLKRDDGRTPPETFVVDGFGKFVAVTTMMVYDQDELNVVNVLWEPSLKLVPTTSRVGDDPR